MDGLIFHITKNHLFGIGSLVGLSLITYLIRRYINNTEKTSNHYYLNSNEIDNTSRTNMITKINSKLPTVHIFWNGDIDSTYLLIDQLLQDNLVQPLYIERYTIHKVLEHETLEKYIAKFKAFKLNPKLEYDSKIKAYLEDIARMKYKQKNEMSMIDLLRRVIINQYPEFKNHLLPTQYITMIEKDLSFTQTFYDQIRHLTPPEYQGIEFYEQAIRYIKYAKLQKENVLGRVMLGYSKNSHLIRIITKIEKNINYNFGNNLIIELPLRNIDDNAIRYLATEIVKNDVMRVLC